MSVYNTHFVIHKYDSHLLCEWTAAVVLCVGLGVQISDKSGEVTLEMGVHAVFDVGELGVLSEGRSPHPVTQPTDDTDLENRNRRALPLKVSY